MKLYKSLIDCTFLSVPDGDLRLPKWLFWWGKLGFFSLLPMPRPGVKHHPLLHFSVFAIPVPRVAGWSLPGLALEEWSWPTDWEQRSCQQFFKHHQVILNKSNNNLKWKKTQSNVKSRTLLKLLILLWHFLSMCFISILF